MSDARREDARPEAMGDAGSANPKTDPAPDTNTVKDPDDWTTGEEPMTGAQASYLKTLSEKTNTPYEDGLTKAEASKRIDALRAEAGLAGGR